MTKKTTEGKRRGCTAIKVPTLSRGTHEVGKGKKEKGGLKTQTVTMKTSRGSPMKRKKTKKEKKKGKDMVNRTERKGRPLRRGVTEWRGNCPNLERGESRGTNARQGKPRQWANPPQKAHQTLDIQGKGELGIRKHKNHSTQEE